MPKNFFQETEQVALAPGNLVPGIEPSEDRLLQGRIFSYSDTQMYRLGANHQQIPVNRPVVNVNNNNQRDSRRVSTRQDNVSPRRSSSSRRRVRLTSFKVLAEHLEGAGCPPIRSVGPSASSNAPTPGHHYLLQYMDLCPVEFSGRPSCFNRGLFTKAWLSVTRKPTDRNRMYNRLL